ncbi:MAG: Fe-S cluster biogenesis protein NfuA [Candidatus Paceibacteria bacterium]|jgi:Fe-S cluster biogenesis protein NfuA
MSLFENMFGSTGASAPKGDPERIAEVEKILEVMRPSFKADGGDIRLERVDEFGWVEVSMHGACDGCMASTLTLRGALEPELRRQLDWVEGLRTV